MLAPPEALPHLKCSICNKYLSYFPISTAQDTKNPICGRCSDLMGADNYIRDTTYEALATFIKFPCIYAPEGCVEHLTPIEIPSHEKNCPHRSVSCALECVWQGSVNELLNHVEDSHPNSIMRDGEFEVNTLGSYEVYNFVKHGDELFTMKRVYDSTSKILQCSLFCYKLLDQVTEYFYEITIYNATRNLSVKFPMKSADTFQQENIVEIGVENVTKCLDDPLVMIGSVRLLTKEDQNLVDIAMKKPNPEINLDMLSELECPVCMEYIIPPIYQCVTGHSICADCKSQIKECPSCKGDIKNTQNFTLEKMAYLITYPCKFAEYGCDFASKPGQIKQHQKFCPLGPKFCPLHDYEKCKWSGAQKDIYSHVIKKHHDNLLEIDNIYVFLNDGYSAAEDHQYYIKKFANAIFILHYKYSQNCFYWAMQLLGPPEEAKNYKFEIDIQDQNCNNQKMFIRSTCASFKEKKDAFATVGEYVFVTFDQIRSFIVDQLSYTIRVSK